MGEVVGKREGEKGGGGRGDVETTACVMICGHFGIDI